jgi:hypothetical protein
MIYPFVYKIDNQIYYIGHGKILKIIKNRLPHPYDECFKMYREFIQKYQKGDRNFDNKYIDNISDCIYTLSNMCSTFTNRNKSDYDFSIIDSKNLDNEIKSKIDKSMDIFSNTCNYVNVVQKHSDIKDF